VRWKNKVSPFCDVQTDFMSREAGQIAIGI
jgi:hypothetical protein